MPRPYRPLAIEKYNPVLTNFPALDILSHDEAPTVCVQINTELASYVVGLLEIYRWEDKFSGTGEAIARSNGVIQQLMAALSTGDCDVSDFKLRPKPTNKYILEQSLDAGVTWEFAYDFSWIAKLGGSGDIFQINNISNQTINDWEQTWNNNPTINNFAPSLVLTGNPAEDALTEHAICYAIGLLIDMIIEFIIEQIENYPVADLIALGVGILLIIGAVFPPVGTAAALILTVVTQEAVETAQSAFSWATAEIIRAERNDLICSMYERLKTATISESSFASSLDDFWPGVPVTDSRALVRMLVQTYLVDTRVFLAFIQVCVEAREYAKSNIQLPCDCDDWDWVHQLNLDADNENWEIEIAYPTTLGVYVPGDQFNTVDYQGHEILRFHRLFAPVVSGMRKIGVQAFGGPSNGGERAIYANGQFVGNMPSSGGTFTTDFDWLGTLNSLRIVFEKLNDTSARQKVSNVWLYGVGHNPFLP